MCSKTRSKSFSKQCYVHSYYLSSLFYHSLHTKNNEVNDREMNKLGDGNISNNNFVEHKKSFVLKKQIDVTMLQENCPVPPVPSFETFAVSQESSESHEPIGEMVVVSSRQSSTLLLFTPTAGDELPNEIALSSNEPAQTDVSQPVKMGTKSDVLQEEGKVFESTVQETASIATEEAG